MQLCSCGNSQRSANHRLCLLGNSIWLLCIYDVVECPDPGELLTVAFPCGPSALSVIKPQAWVESSHSLPARREPLSSRSASSALLHSAFWSSSGAEQFCFRAEHVNRFGILGFLPPCNFTGGNFEDISNIQAFGSSKEIIIIDCYNNRVDSANRGERADCLHGEEIGRSGGELGVGGGRVGGGREGEHSD